MGARKLKKPLFKGFFDCFRLFPLDCTDLFPYTRIIEHKHFEDRYSDKTVITREYPESSSGSREPYYPINDDNNDALYRQYRELAKGCSNVIFGERLGEYRYYDMDETEEALAYWRSR